MVQRSSQHSAGYDVDPWVTWEDGLEVHGWLVDVQGDLKTGGFSWR